MDNAIRFVLFHQLLHSGEITYICFYKSIVRLVFYIFEIRQISGVCQFIEIDNTVIGIFIDKQANDMRSYKSGASGNDDIAFKFHDRLFLFKFFYAFY